MTLALVLVGFFAPIAIAVVVVVVLYQVIEQL